MNIKLFLTSYARKMGSWIKYDIITFIKKWSDILICAPIAFVAFCLGGWWIRKLDPTSAPLETGVLSVLNFNILIIFLVNSISYFLYALYFTDGFQKKWDEGLEKRDGKAIHLILWISMLVINYLIITRNL